ncbi:MlaD family protein [Actinomadura sp. HBU206391]|uniref:MlaD family protein n=1 Tax=Actinomadura sp. HBU206391 TaxID=2731692 RepID=UPI00164FFB2B|nr:MlaD family protein [Actinomadura sp. HBU206391]MBC6460074.1 MCE family protein [Actinomadura sp. HBU206391]
MNSIDQSLSRRSRAVFGAVGAGVIALGAFAAVRGVTPSHSGTYYTAAFGRAGQGLDERSDVKVRGITVGGVESVSLDGRGRANVRIRVEKGIRVPRTTVAGIEPVSVFGPKDIVLDLGPGEGAGPYLSDGAPITRTKDPQELADVAWPAYKLTAAIDPQELSAIVHTFAEGLRGKGPQLRRTIGNGDKLLDQAYGNRAQIRLLLADVEGLGATFGGRGDTLVGITRDLGDVSPVLTDRPDKIDQLLDGSARLADSVSRNLEVQGDQLGALLDTGGRAIEAVHSELRNMPVLINGLTAYFGTLATIVRVPGPNGKLLAQVVTRLPLDLCKTLVDLCELPIGPASGTGGRR